MRPIQVAALIAAASLAACSRPLERPDRPFVVQAPQAWKAASEEASGVLAGDWWAYFGDPGLDRAISEALTQNQDLTAAAARIEQAHAQARIAGAAELPALEAGFVRNRQRFNFIGLPIPGEDGSAVLSVINTTLQPTLNLTWEADVWGRISSGKAAAIADVDASHADLAGAQLSLTGQTAKAWFAALEAKRQVQLARATLDNFEFSAERVRARFLGGVRPSLDLRLALTEVDRARALLEQRQAQRDSALRQLETLLGRYPGAEYELAEDLPDCPRGLPAGLPAELVHRRPDLVAAERRLLAADARIAQSQADLRPRFNITGGTGTMTNELSQILSGQVFVWNLLTGVTQPIFNNGRLKAAVAQNEARAFEAAAQFESSLLRAYREVETAIAADRFLAQQEEALEAAVQQSAAAQELAESRYRSGLADIITMLEAQRRALDAESALLNLRRARLENRVDLHLALGGGFSAAVDSLIDDPGGQGAGRERL